MLTTQIISVVRESTLEARKFPSTVLPGLNADYIVGTPRISPCVNSRGSSAAKCRIHPLPRNQFPSETHLRSASVASPGIRCSSPSSPGDPSEFIRTNGRGIPLIAASDPWPPYKWRAVVRAFDLYGRVRASVPGASQVSIAGPRENLLHRSVGESIRRAIFNRARRPSNRL